MRFMAPDLSRAALCAGVVLLAGCEAIGRPPVRGPDVADERYGFRATFPAGFRICDSSGSLSMVRGYHQTFEERPPRCDSIRQETAPGMGLIATDAPGAAMEQLRRELCPVEVPAGERSAGVESLVIDGRTSVSCQARNTDGSYTVAVATLARMTRDPAPPADAPPRIVLYQAGLNTDAGRIAQDLPVFRAFLTTIEIDPPEWRAAPAH